MNFRWMLLAILVILILGGLVSSAYANTITRDLTMPRIARQGNTLYPVTTSTSTPNSTMKPTKVGQLPATTLAHDTFQRADQALWGSAIDGQHWEGDANAVSTFSIVGGMGQLAGGQGTFNAILGPTAATSEVLISATASSFDAGKVNIGAAIRWNDPNNWYKALIDGTQLAIIKHINGVGKLLASVPFHARPGIVYSIRIRAQGTMFFAKVWPTTTAEPANWMIMISDTSLTSGRGGIRIVEQKDATVRVSAFLETTVTTSS